MFKNADMAEWTRRTETSKPEARPSHATRFSDDTFGGGVRNNSRNGSSLLSSRLVSSRIMTSKMRR